MSLLTAYKNLHSLVRTQIFAIRMWDIPMSVGGCLVRHIHAQPYMLSKRPDRGAEDFIDVCRNIAFAVRTAHVPNGDISEMVAICQAQADEVDSLPDRFDRHAPTDLGLLLNAEEIMNISAKRLCSKASVEAREVWRGVLEKIEMVDPDLVKFCHRPCVLTGICRESKNCGYIGSMPFMEERDAYEDLFFSDEEK